MRDSLFDLNEAYLSAYRIRCENARMDADGFRDAEEITCGLAMWCRDVLFNTHLVESLNDDPRLSDLLALPSAESPLQAFGAIGDLTRRQSLKSGFAALIEGRENKLRNGLAWLLGRALAKGLVETIATQNAPSKHLLTSLVELVNSHELVFSAFEVSLRKRLEDSSAARVSIVSELDSRICEIVDNPGSGTYSFERDAFNLFIDTWRSSSSIEKLWKDQQGPSSVYYRTLRIVPGILSTDRATISNSLNRFDFPHPVRQIFQHNAIVHDRDEIAELLKVAPICSEDGGTWNGGFLPFLVLQTAEDHCHALWEAMWRARQSGELDSELTEGKRDALRTWFEELGRIVMARPDGRFIGPQWLFMKVMDERTDRVRRRGLSDWPQKFLLQHELIEWIVRGLVRAGLNRRYIDAQVSFPDNSNRDQLAPANRSPRSEEQVRPRLAALSMMGLVDHMIGAARAEEAQVILDRLDALLAMRDPAFEVEAIANAGTGDLPASCCGHVLSSVEEPATRWRHSWDMLIEQRRRVQYWDNNNDSDALAPTLFLLAMGTSCIDWLLSTSPYRADIAKKLWRELFGGVRECWLTISLSHLVEQIETHIGRLFARHPLVFGHLSNEQDARELNFELLDNNYGALLARDLDLLGGNDMMLTICCLNARYNGATPAIMSEVLKYNSGCIGRILQQFEKWQHFSRQAERNSEIVEALVKLRVEIEQLGTA